MRQKTTNYQNILFLLIPTFILILAWVGFNVYSSRVRSTITDVQAGQITPISPIFDFNTLTLLKSRDSITPVLTFQAPPPDEDDLIASDSAQESPLLSPLEDLPSEPQASGSATQPGGTP